VVAHEDPDGVLRLNAEQMVVEVLREGRPATPGELGEVVVTHFYTEIMPFIRYATGDVVRQPQLEDPPAAGLPRFPLPEGRTSDQLVGTDGNVCSMRPVIETLVGEVGLKEFRLHQQTQEAVQMLELESQPIGLRQRGQVEDVLQAFLGDDLKVQWQTGSRFVPLTSGKHRYVCSPAALLRLAHDRESGLAQARAWPQRLVRTS
jgi:phenylacetate-CoA ligase